MNAKQEEALREYLQETIVPLIEQVLVKKLGQAMTYASQELIQTKREWQGLTDEEIHHAFCHVEFETPHDWLREPEAWCVAFAKYLEAILKEKNNV